MMADIDLVLRRHTPFVMHWDKGQKKDYSVKISIEMEMKIKNISKIIDKPKRESGSGSDVL